MMGPKGPQGPLRAPCAFGARGAPSAPQGPLLGRGRLRRPALCRVQACPIFGEAALACRQSWSASGAERLKLHGYQVEAANLSS